MTGATFKAKLGRQRVTKSLAPYQASYVRDIREQMKVIQDNLNGFIGALKNATPQILLDALTPTFAKSVVYCPKRTHRLAQSGYLEVAETSRGVTAEMGYARGGDPFYAAIVHERTDIPHQAPTRAKFLQSALEEDSSDIPKRIAQGYRDSVGG